MPLAVSEVLDSDKVGMGRWGSGCGCGMGKHGASFSWEWGCSLDRDIATGNDEREQTVNQLLTEMDGFESNKGVVSWR